MAKREDRQAVDMHGRLLEAVELLSVLAVLTDKETERATKRVVKRAQGFDVKIEQAGFRQYRLSRGEASEVYGLGSGRRRK